jgi:hypothetical protein
MGSNAKAEGVIMATDERIKELAYSIWEEDGHPEGKDVEYYFRAKQILWNNKS